VFPLIRGLNERQMRIIRKERAYEGLPAGSAVAMAVMETSGIRALIDKNVEYDRERRLSPGMAVKAMIGPIFDGRKKLPLSGVRYFYNAAPADILFGKGVERASLNDNALARNLDDIFDTGLDELFWKCSKLIRKKYGFDTPSIWIQRTIPCSRRRPSMRTTVLSHCPHSVGMRRINVTIFCSMRHRR
jgi:hypothetical protein